MIRNPYNYLTPSVQYTKGKEVRTSCNGTTNKTLQAESQKDSFFPKIDQTDIENKKKNHQDIYAKTYNERTSKLQQKHRLRTISKKKKKKKKKNRGRRGVGGVGLKSILRGHNSRP